MRTTYWPLVIPIALASAAFFLATQAVRKGVVMGYGFGDGSGPVTRDDNPIQFWITVILSYLVRLALRASIVFVIDKGGIKCE